ncbi:MAG: biotin--[acetyl-CoA-carboxylase] ligase [Candidatus Dormibacteria bacterium]
MPTSSESADEAGRPASNQQQRRLDPARLRRLLSAAGMRLDTRFQSQVASTQDVVLSAIAGGIGEGLVVFADHQEAGRGRAGRRWVAPAGTSLMFSLLWRPPSLAQGSGSLALAAGLAVAEGIEGVGGPPVQLKWPNDCMVSGQKVAGLLMEGTSQGPPGLALGVGCNVAWSSLPEASRPGPGATALDLHGAPVDFTELAASLLLNLERRYRQWRTGGFAPMRELWQDRMAWMGREVEVSLPGRRLSGLLVGVAADGTLRLEQGGQETRVAAGDLAQIPGGSLRLTAAGSS